MELHFCVSSVTVTPFNISLPGTIQEVMVGSPLMIQCTVSEVESGSVMISWMGPGGDITSGVRVTIISTGSISTLNFVYLMEGDEGTYTCNVMSSMGISRSEAVEIDTLTGKSFSKLKIFRYEKGTNLKDQ